MDTPVQGAAAPGSQDSATAPTAPQQGSAPAAAPITIPTVPAQAPPGGDSAELQAQLEAAEKRVQDTQRAFHEKAQETVKLKNELNSIFNHPIYGPVLKAGLGDQTVVPGKPVEDDVKRAWLEYQSAPNDEAAFAKLLQFAEDRGSRRAMGELEIRLNKQRDEQAAVQRQVLAAQTINEAVTQQAPDVPLELFWAMAGRAERETPGHVTHPDDRLVWQIARAVELSRGVLNPMLQKATAAAGVQTSVNQAGAVIMPGGGASPTPGGGAAPAQAKNMVEQIKEMQARAMTGRRV